MGPSKLKVWANILTTIGIFGPLAAGIFQTFVNSRATGITTYGPYSVVGLVDNQSTFAGLGFLLVVTVSNWVVANGLRCHFLGSRKTRFISSLGLLVPISLEIVGFLRSAVFTGAVADMPRRYHYYYFAPVPKSSLQALWDFFIPKTVWPVATHFGCLVLLILGYVSATQNSESA